MYCRFCGKQIPDNAKFCSECGANLAPAPSAAPEESAPAVTTTPEIPTVPAMPVQGTPDPAASGVIETPQRGMKWFKFIIYFQLWVTLLVCLIDSSAYYTGSFYEGSTELIYSYWPSLKALDVIMSILLFAMGVYAVCVQRALAKFRAKGPVMYYILCGAGILVSLIYITAASNIIGESTANAETLYDFFVSVILLFINIRYFNNRKHLFVNP